MKRNDNISPKKIKNAKTENKAAAKRSAGYPDPIVVWLGGSWDTANVSSGGFSERRMS